MQKFGDKPPNPHKNIVNTGGTTIRYFVTFINQTGEERPWTMGVYQTLPNSVGLDSVSWKQTTVPRGGRSSVFWDITYDVALANYQQRGGKGIFESTQVLPTDLGKYWDIVFQDGVQQLIPGKPPEGMTIDPQQIVIKNKSNLPANPGIGVSGTGSVFKKNVLNTGNAQFKVTPTYWAGLFTDLSSRT